MKTTKKVMAILLALVMVAALSVSAFAANGSITVENATKGVEYNAYKIFDATYKGSAVTYKVAESETALVDAVKAASDLFKISDVASQGSYSVDLVAGNDVQDVIAWVEDNIDLFTAVKGVEQADGTVKFDVPYGYYYVTSSLGAVVSVDTNMPDVVIKDKNPNAPSDADKTVNGAAADDAAIGTVQNYQVTFNATNWVQSKGGEDAQQVTVFNVTDTYKNLRVDQSTVEILVNGAAPVEDPTINVSNKEDGTGGTMTISIPWADDNNVSYYSYQKDATSIPVVITYKATVTSAAVNTASNEVVIDNDATDDTLTDSTTTTTYNLTVNKTDENGAPLAGAKFTLTLEGGAEVQFVKVAKGNSQTLAAADATEWDYRVAETGEAGASTELVTDADGSFVIYGLDKASYVLHETEAPAGYGVAADKTVEVGTVESVDVVDTFSQPLPTTGSIGTTIFYILGSILVIGAGVVLVSKRRMTE